jgi:hypothetical protein
MHAHTYLSHKSVYTCMCIYTYTSVHIFRLSYAQLYQHTWTPAHARAHTSTHTHARAHTGPRRTDDPPSASRPRWRAAGPERAAHTDSNVVTDAVFHAPMFALNADADWNACAPRPPAVDADGRRAHVSARMRGRPIAHARARTDA